MNDEYSLYDLQDGWTWPQLEVIGECFLRTVADHPGSTAQQLAERMRLQVSDVQAACEYAVEMDMLVRFCGHHFIATTANERARQARIARLWNQAATLIKTRQ